MKKNILRGGILILALAATHATVSADEGPGMEGVWFADITAIDCTTHAALPNVPTFRGLYMFGHDGSVTNEAAFLAANVRRSSGLGSWQHTQAQKYTSTFRFFRYNSDGSIMTIRQVTMTIALDGGLYTSIDQFQDFDQDYRPIPSPTSSGCNAETGMRLP